MRKPSSRSVLSASPTSKVGLKRGPWTAAEDELLVNCIRRHGEGRWRTLPNRAGLLRCGKSCRLRWVNYLRPSIKRGPIDPDEEDLILRLHRLLGNRWALIAGRIPGRTDNEIKNYWNSHLRKKLISQGIDPRTHKPLNPNSNSNPNSSGTTGFTILKLPPIPYPKLNPNCNPNSAKTIDSTIPNLPPFPNSQPNPISNSSKTMDSTKLANLPPIPYPKPKPKSSETIDSMIQNLPAIFNPNPTFSGLEQQENSKVIYMDGDPNPMIDTSNEEGLQDCDMLMNMGLQSNYEIGEDAMDLCNDDIFSSFLNSLINEDVFENQLPNFIAPATSMAALGEEQQDG